MRLSRDILSSQFQKKSSQDEDSWRWHSFSKDWGKQEDCDQRTSRVLSKWSESLDEAWGEISCLSFVYSISKEVIFCFLLPHLWDFSEFGLMPSWFDKRVICSARSLIPFQSESPRAEAKEDKCIKYTTTFLMLFSWISYWKEFIHWLHPRMCVPFETREPFLLTFLVVSRLQEKRNSIDPKVNQDQITLDQNQKNCNHRRKPWSDFWGIREKRILGMKEKLLSVLPFQEKRKDKNWMNKRLTNAG